MRNWYGKHPGKDGLRELSREAKDAIIAVDEMYRKLRDKGKVMDALNRKILTMDWERMGLLKTQQTGAGKIDVVFDWSAMFGYSHDMKYTPTQ